MTEEIMRILEATADLEPSPVFIFIPANDGIIECGHFSRNGYTELLRKYRYEPETILFLADMLED